jgi:hypothetical protein
MNERLKILRDYFPTAVYNGKELIFISEDSQVKLTEHIRGGLSEGEKISVIRVRLYAKNEHSEFEPSHYEDFHLENIADLAGEIEKYIQHAIGKNLKE